MKRKLSTVEMTVLGLAWLRGPCTIYAIMKDLSASESSYHRSRAGTAYSVAHRLVGFGMLETRNDQITITEPGRAALLEWLGPTVSPEEIAYTVDLLRLRCFFLEALPMTERLQFIDQAVAALEALETRLDGLLDENEAIGEFYGLLATVNAILETRARKQWLRLIHHWVENPIADQAEWAKTIRAYIV